MIKEKWGIDAFWLRILACIAMLCDHVWAMMISGNFWMTCFGRIAMPIFAFQLVEGFFHTHNLKKYILRMFLFAILTEIPFNLMMGSSIIYPFHQNILFTFLIALLAMAAMQKVREKAQWWIAVPACMGITLLASAIATVFMTDYFGFGVLTVLIFYFLRNFRFAWAAQLAAMFAIHWSMMGGRVIPVAVGSFFFEIPEQAFALLALIPIWLYNGKKGFATKWSQLAFYSFYPVHMLVLWLILNLK